MRVMVTGAGGMTGSELARQAVALGWECDAYDRSRLDVTDENKVSEVVRHTRPDVVLNAAACTAVDAAESDRDEAMRVNADGARNLARAAAEAGAAIVHISTDYVFDGAGTRPYRPSDDVRPLNAYGESKLGGEIAVRHEAATHAIVRTSWIYSHDGRNFLRTVLHAATEGKELRVVDDQQGSPTAAADLAAALLVASEKLRSDPSLSGTYHFSNAGTTTWYGFAKEILEVRGGDASSITPIPTDDYPTAARRPMYSVLDTSSFTDAFGVKPRRWEQALRETMARVR
ncbi:MAG: dTDP-4-dehydrorhamnose reductase [Gemmatimonadales bacterium]